MSAGSSQSKYLAQAYATRIMGYGFILAIVLSTVYTQFEPLLHGSIIAVCLVLPNSLYLFSRFTSLENSTRWAEYIDIIFLGLLLTHLHWGVFPLLFIMAGICVSAIMTIGLGFFLRAMAVLLATVAVNVPLTGYRLELNSSMLTALICSLGVLTYASAIGMNAFNQRAYLNRTRRQLREQKEKIEILASKLSKYLSPQVYRSIFAGERDVRVESYQKRLTVLFSDIVGFTGIAESMEHEQLANWLNSYFNEMSEIAINQYSGTLDKFIGDSLMVFFGDPHSLGEKEDAVHCVRMAQAMVHRCTQMGVAVRIGIHSGECTVGNFGSDDRLEYTIIGGTVNQAARLESSSTPGRILISAATHELVKSEIPCEPRGRIRLRGICDEVDTYWVGTQPHRNQPGQQSDSNPKGAEHGISHP